MAWLSSLYAMTSTRPYFVRAIYEWLNDNNLTPYLELDATFPGVQVPTRYVKDGRIVLNIGPAAVDRLFLRNDEVSFSARFGGQPMQVIAPMDAVLGIYARENGEGLRFQPIAAEPQPDAAPSTGSDEPPEPTPPKRPGLRVVK